MRTLFLGIDKLLSRIEEFLLASSVLLLGGITIGNVISRKLFNASWSWAEEVLQFILVIVTFMGISYAARRSRHIRMTALFEAVGEPARKVFMVCIAAVTAGVLFYLAWYALLYVERVYAMGRVTPALRIPFWLAVIWAPLGLFTGGVQYFFTLIKNLTTKGVWVSSRVPFACENEQDMADDFVFNYERKNPQQ